MSKDLAVINDLSKDAQYVQDQDGNKSTLSLSTGSVGIATKSTDNPLTVQSSGKGKDVIEVVGSSGNSLISLRDGANGHGNLFLRTSDGDSKVRFSAGTGKSYINNGENVGVGTDNPGALLDVNGSAQVKTLVILKMAAASEAPSGANLETVLIDPTTGNLYYQ